MSMYKVDNETIEKYKKVIEEMKDKVFLSLSKLKNCAKKTIKNNNDASIFLTNWCNLSEEINKADSIWLKKFRPSDYWNFAVSKTQDKSVFDLIRKIKDEKTSKDDLAKSLKALIKYCKTIIKNEKDKLKDCPDYIPYKYKLDHCQVFLDFAKKFDEYLCPTN